MALRIALPPFPNLGGFATDVRKAESAVGDLFSGAARGAAHFVDSFEADPGVSGLIEGFDPRPLAPSQPDPLRNPSDPFEPDGIVSKGPYAGRRLDQSQARSVHQLTAQEAAPYDPAPGEMLIANFQYEGQFYIARVPTDAIQDVVYQEEHIPTGGGPVDGTHNQIRFILKPGKEITLIPQVAGSSAPDVQLNQLFFTCEGMVPPGETWDIATTGMEDRAAIVYRMMSLDDKWSAMVSDGQHHHVEQWRLNLSDAQKQAVFAHAVEEGTDAGSRNMYNTLTCNCTTEAMKALDSAIDYGPLRDALAEATGRFYPGFAAAYLGERGLIDSRSRMPDMLQEMGGQ